MVLSVFAMFESTNALNIMQASGTMSSSSRMRFQQYREVYRQYGYTARQHERLKEELHALFRGDPHRIRAYHDIIYPAVSAPYVFSDHAAKSFERQHEYLQHRHPEVCDTSQPILALALARRHVATHAPLGTLPPELLRRIHEYARNTAPTHEMLLRAMALASHVAWHWHSD